MKIRILLVIALLFHIVSWAQAPKLTGNIYIELANGQITCDFTLSNLPKLSDLALGLNRGFNIKDLRLNDTSTSYNIDWGFPGRTVFLAEGIGIVPNLDTLLPGTKISISYTGAFPVYKANEETASGDRMSTLAIKDNILRASHQTLWYPVLVDRATNFTITKFEYEINVVCKDCESIYLGGTVPIRARQAKLKTTEPNDIMLYAGKYDFLRSDNSFFLNSNLGKKEAAVINSTLDSIKRFYTEVLQAAYTQPTVLAQIFTIGPKSQYEKWAFVVYPCIVSDLNDLSRHVDVTTNRLTDINTFRIYSHELAHNFFGLKLRSENEYWGFYSESFSEYLCLKAVEKFFGKDSYITFLNQRYLSEKALSKTYTPLTNLTSGASATLLYNYYPILLIGLEQVIGQERMYKLLAHLVNQTKATNLNAGTLKQSALDTGITIEEWTGFERDYIKSVNCLPLVKAKL